MTMFKKNKIVKALFMSGLLTAGSMAGTALAAVSESEAAKLGQELTWVGAEKAANADGSIPAWDGGITNLTEGTDPFASEQPLFTITAQNMAQYKDKLSAGQIALFEKYPDTYKMPVYQSHRTAYFPQKVYDLAKKNATQTELAEGGNGLVNFDETVPFAIPQNGLEVIWNHITRYRGGSVERTMAVAPVHQNGDFTTYRIQDKLVWPHYLTDGYKEDKDSNMLFYFTMKVLAPARLTGNVLLVHETLNQVKEARKSWVYNAGQRRVRRAPQVSYDGPGFAADGQRTSDNFDMFNGAPDKYDWKLIGKQEMYIPYNAFKLASKDLKYKDILMPGHLNPENTRYELHRVWVIEADLKDGERHIYAKRRMYIDEDSWQAAVVDHYDGRGELWRVAEAHKVQYKSGDAPWYAMETLHDLQSGRYLTTGMTNEESVGLDFGIKAKHSDFTPAAIRRAGKR